MILAEPGTIVVSLAGGSTHSFLEGQSMKKALALLAMGAFTFVVAAPAFAQTATPPAVKAEEKAEKKIEKAEEKKSEKVEKAEKKAAKEKAAAEKKAAKTEMKAEKKAAKTEEKAEKKMEKAEEKK